jgi:hypothetical protein
LPVRPSAIAFVVTTADEVLSLTPLKTSEKEILYLEKIKQVISFYSSWIS